MRSKVNIEPIIRLVRTIAKRIPVVKAVFIFTNHFLASGISRFSNTSIVFIEPSKLSTLHFYKITDKTYSEKPYAEPRLIKEIAILGTRSPSVAIIRYPITPTGIFAPYFALLTSSKLNEPGVPVKMQSGSVLYLKINRGRRKCFNLYLNSMASATFLHLVCKHTCGNGLYYKQIIFFSYSFLFHSPLLVVTCLQSLQQFALPNHVLCAHIK